jgi:hypothetical protein
VVGKHPGARAVRDCGSGCEVMPAGDGGEEENQKYVGANGRTKPGAVNEQSGSNHIRCVSGDEVFDQDFTERFWKKVTKSEGCWKWTGQKDKNGYGVLKLHQKVHKAYRVSYEIATGKSPIGFCVLHRCDNPGCVNPDHLYLGTPADNARDRKMRGRGGNLKGENNGRAKLNIHLVREIRLLFSTGAYSKVKLGKIYGITDVQIGQIVRNIHWKEEDYRVQNCNKTTE